ncbi:MAG TPA: hypothetical protein GXX72_08360 [Clostridiaceae bacterium]|nr:hypothetical protein [Clostridiaceae bacterium]
MKKTYYKVLSFLIVALMLATLITACGKKNDIVGKWVPEGESEAFGMEGLSMLGIEPEDIYLEFTSGGEVIIMVKDKPIMDYMKDFMKEMGASDEEVEEVMGESGLEIKYKLDGDKIKMEMKTGEETDSQEGTYKREGDKLTIKFNDEETVFVKKK